MPRWLASPRFSDFVPIDRAKGLDKVTLRCEAIFGHIHAVDEFRRRHGLHELHPLIHPLPRLVDDYDGQLDAESCPRDWLARDFATSNELDEQRSRAPAGDDYSSRIT